MLTKKDRAFLKETFATKDDLKGLEKRFDQKFATKDDLKGLEKRLDQKFATKDDLKGFATKDDLRSLKTDLLVELSKTRNEIIRQIRDFIEDSLMPFFDNHEQRINRVEKKLNLPSLVD